MTEKNKTKPVSDIRLTCRGRRGIWQHGAICKACFVETLWSGRRHLLIVRDPLRKSVFIDAFVGILSSYYSQGCSVEKLPQPYWMVSLVNIWHCAKQESPSSWVDRLKGHDLLTIYSTQEHSLNDWKSRADNEGIANNCSVQKHNIERVINERDCWARKQSGVMIALSESKDCRWVWELGRVASSR